MPFIPHTQTDIDEMLDVIGIKNIDALFSEIPAALRNVSLSDIPSGVSECALTNEMQARARLDEIAECYLGGGAYEHHIPAAVWQIAARGEWMTAYTPYQAEASQGSLQLIYEFQTMMASLMGLEVANASMYDGASALAEAVLMAVRLHKKGKDQILMPTNLHPHYRQTVQSIVRAQHIQLVDVPFDVHTGKIDLEFLRDLDVQHVAAIIIPQPNFFGVIDDVDALTNWAHALQLLAIAVVNPLAMALLKPPGEWGDQGADIACGEGQPLGIPLSGGGPYYGFLCTKKNNIRQLPGRIAGRTLDINGKTGYVLTLQAREQHIRRGKATSNICTNQGLMVTASTIYMSLLGPEGLKQVALTCHQGTEQLKKLLFAIPEIQLEFSATTFHEFVIRLPVDAASFLKKFTQYRIQAGIDLSPYFTDLQNCLLICVTETKLPSQLIAFAATFQEVIKDGNACQS